MRSATLRVGAVILGASFFQISVSSAADKSGNFALHGAGAQSCEMLGKSLKSDPTIASAVASWLQGYMTAVNRFERDTFDIAPISTPTALLNIVVGLCKANPQQPVEIIIRDVLQKLSVGRNPTETPVIEMTSGSNHAVVRQATLAAMQVKLGKLGFFRGSGDGQFGPATESALKAFQTAQKLPVTGVADPVTVVRLLVEIPEPSASR